MAQETWKPVVGYEGWYSVSGFGRVRRDRACRGARAGHLSAIWKHSAGYHTVRLNRERFGVTKFVHRLVAEAFIGAPPSSEHEVNHKDGDRANNLVENLEWVTALENISHSIKVIGRNYEYRCGVRTYCKLTESQVREIREQRGKELQKDLAKRFGVHKKTIGFVQRRQSYASVA